MRIKRQLLLFKKIYKRITENRKGIVCPNKANISVVKDFYILFQIYFLQIHCKHLFTWKNRYLIYFLLHLFWRRNFATCRSYLVVDQFLGQFYLSLLWAHQYLQRLPTLPDTWFSLAELTCLYCKFKLILWWILHLITWATNF